MSEHRNIVQQFKRGHNGRGIKRPELSEKVGHRHPGWKGGLTMSKKYVYQYQPTHRFAENKGYVPQHRLVWEHYHKAMLLPWGIVHHIDGIKSHNWIGNLVAMTKGQHASLHWKQRREQRKLIPFVG